MGPAPERPCELASLPEGSERGLERFAAGEIVAAAIHLHDLDPGETTDANVEAWLRDVKFHDSVMIAFARREQGLVVAPGNPLALRSIDDVLWRSAPSWRCVPRGPAPSCCCLPSSTAPSAERPSGRPGQALVSRTGPRHRPGDPRRPRRLRRCDPLGRQRGRPRFRLARLGAFRSGHAPARLLPPVAGRPCWTSCARANCRCGPYELGGYDISTCRRGAVRTVMRNQPRAPRQLPRHATILTWVTIIS